MFPNHCLVFRYRALSPKSREYYKNLGDMATMTWRHGFRSFGQRLHRQPQPSLTGTHDPPGSILQTGTIVQADAPREEHLSILLPSLTCKFEKGLKHIRREQRQLNAALSQEDKHDENEVQESSSEIIEKHFGGEASLVTGVPSGQLFANASQHHGDGRLRSCTSRTATFTPPLIDFVAASWWC